MAIIIDKPEKDLHLSQDEYNRLLTEYQQSYMFYSGTPPTFETWARKKAAKPHNDHPMRHFDRTCPACNENA